MNVTLTPQLEGWVEEQVASGRYHDASEVVREALRLWDTTRKLNEFRDDILDDDAPSGGRCVADMFADHEAERRRSA